MSAENLVKMAIEQGIWLATAESCTGGMIAAAITDVAGASEVFERGFVTYSNQAKHDMIDVPMELIEVYGAVSEQVARAMAEGAVKHSRAQLAVAVTGIAGPGGGSVDKPVGTVHIAVANESGCVVHKLCQFPGDRQAVREQTVEMALCMLGESVSDSLSP